MTESDDIGDDHVPLAETQSSTGKAAPTAWEQKQEPRECECHEAELEDNARRPSLSQDHIIPAPPASREISQSSQLEPSIIDPPPPIPPPLPPSLPQLWHMPAIPLYPLPAGVALQNVKAGIYVFDDQIETAREHNSASLHTKRRNKRDESKDFGGVASASAKVDLSPEKGPESRLHPGPFNEDYSNHRRAGTLTEEQSEARCGEGSSCKEVQGVRSQLDPNVSEPPFREPRSIVVLGEETYPPTLDEYSPNSSSHSETCQEKECIAPDKTADLALARGESTAAAQHLMDSLDIPKEQSRPLSRILRHFTHVFHNRREVCVSDLEKEDGQTFHDSLAIDELNFPPKFNLLRRIVLGNFDEFGGSYYGNHDEFGVHYDGDAREIDSTTLTSVLNTSLRFLRSRTLEATTQTMLPGPQRTDVIAEANIIANKADRVASAITVGATLNHLYEEGVLERPSTDDEKSTLHHMHVLRVTFGSCNIWTDPDLLTWTTLDLSYTKRKLSDFLGSPERLKDAKSLRSFVSYRSGTHKYGTFTAEDLHIGALMDLGKLRICWTPIAEDHLRLVLGGYRDGDASDCSDMGADDTDHNDHRELGDQRDTLYIYWFDAVDISWLAAHFTNDGDFNEATLTALEILRTWSFLLQPGKKSHFKAAIKAYRSLSIPFFLRPYLQSLQDPKIDIKRLDTLGDIVDAQLDSYFHDMQQHMNPNLRMYNISKQGQYSYRLFTEYGIKIKFLKLYMERKRPKGWGQLWRDDRDSSAYYMFWSVVIFGVATLVLAILSLVTSIVQAWASVKALRSSGP